MITFGFIRHVLGAARRALSRMLIWFLVVGGIAAIAVELVSIFANNMQLPTLLTHLAAIAFGVAVGYAAAMTVLVAELFRDLTRAVGDLERGIEHGIEHGMEAGSAALREGQEGITRVMSAAADRERRK